LFCTLKLLVSFSIVEADNVYASRFCQAAFLDKYFNYMHVSLYFMSSKILKVFTVM